MSYLTSWPRWLAKKEIDKQAKGRGMASDLHVLYIVVHRIIVRL